MPAEVDNAFTVAVFGRVQGVQMAGMSGNAIVQGTHMKVT